MDAMVCVIVVVLGIHLAERPCLEQQTVPLSDRVRILTECRFVLVDRL